jgi:dipeptidyl aminopeptidase/acylaminoacyl peptidase
MSVVRQDGDAIYLSGGGASPEGDRPFLDRLNLKTQKSERLFRCDRNCYEQFLSFTGPNANTFLTWRQSPANPPNAFIRTLGQDRPSTKPSAWAWPTPIASASPATATGP